MKKLSSASNNKVIVDIFETNGGIGSSRYLTSKKCNNREEALEYVNSYNHVGFVEGAPTPSYIGKCHSYAKIRE